MTPEEQEKAYEIRKRERREGDEEFDRVMRQFVSGGVEMVRLLWVYKQALHRL